MHRPKSPIARAGDVPRDAAAGSGRRPEHDANQPSDDGAGRAEQSPRQGARRRCSDLRSRGAHPRRTIAGAAARHRSVTMLLGYCAVFAVLGGRWLCFSSFAIPAGAPMVAPGDARLIVWILSWVSHALTSPGVPLFDANINYPATGQLAGSEHFLASQLLFLPVFAGTGNPVLAANVVALVSYPLAAIAMAQLLAMHGCAAGVAWVVGLAYALGPLQVPGNLQILQYPGFALPAVALAVRGLRDRPTARRAIVAVAIGLLVAFSSYYATALSAVVAAVWFVGELLRSRGGRWKFAALAIASGTIVASALAAFSVPYWHQDRSAGPSALYSSDPASTAREVLDTPGAREILQQLAEQFGPLSVSMMREPRFLAAVSRAILTYLFRDWVGLGVVVGVVLSCLALVWRSAGPRELGSRGLILGAIGLLLALGPNFVLASHDVELLSWKVIAVPFGYVRVPFRFLVLTGFGLALLAPLGMSGLLVRVPDRMRTPLLCAFAGVALWSGRQLGGTAPDVLLDRSVEIYRRVGRTAAQMGRGPLLELPIRSGGGRHLVGDSMVGSVQHWLPLVVGRTGYACGHCRELAADLDRLPDPAALAQVIARTGTRWVLLRPKKDWPNPRARDAILRSPLLRPRWAHRGWTLASVADDR